MLEPLLTTDEAAAYLHLAPQTLCDWRYRGTGPAYIRVHRRIRYRRADLEAWVQAQEVRPEEALQRVPAPSQALQRTLLTLPPRQRR
jgi:hypothetical protein